MLDGSQREAGVPTRFELTVEKFNVLDRVLGNHERFVCFSQGPEFSLFFFRDADFSPVRLQLVKVIGLRLVFFVPGLLVLDVVELLFDPFALEGGRCEAVLEQQALEQQPVVLVLDHIQQSEGVQAEGVPDEVLLDFRQFSAGNLETCVDLFHGLHLVWGDGVGYLVVFHEFVAFRNDCVQPFYLRFVEQTTRHGFHDEFLDFVVLVVLLAICTRI